MNQPTVGWQDLVIYMYIGETYGWKNSALTHTMCQEGVISQASSPFSSSPKVLLSRHNSVQSLGKVKDTNLARINDKKPHADEKCIYVCFAYKKHHFFPREWFVGSWTQCRRTLHFVWEQKLVIMYVSLKFEVFHEICHFSAARFCCLWQLQPHSTTYLYLQGCLLMLVTWWHSYTLGWKGGTAGIFKMPGYSMDTMSLDEVHSM